MLDPSPIPTGLAASLAAPLPPSRPERLWQLTLDKLNTRPEDELALTLCLPFCATHCLCCDRDVRCTPTPDLVARCVDTLLRESRLLAGRLSARRRVRQLHLVGGSVTELGEVPLLRLLDGLHDDWQLAPDADITAHADARRLAPGLLRLLRGQGFNRLVLGVLDFDPRVQQLAARRQSIDLVADACAQARACGLDGIQLDLMIGLPLQTDEGWRATVEQTLSLAPQWVRLRQYRHRPRHSPAQALFEADALPDRSRCRRMEQLARHRLRATGYQPAGGDLFRLGDDAAPPAEIRTPWLGCGPGATSRIDGRVFFNHGRLPDWQARVHAGQLPVSHTRRQVWAWPSERLRPSCGSEPWAFDHTRRALRVTAPAAADTPPTGR